MGGKSTAYDTYTIVAFCAAPLERTITTREERGRKVQNEEERRGEKKIPTTKGRLLRDWAETGVRVKT